MIIKDIETIKKFFREKRPLIFGTGVYAFYRLGLEDIVPNYRILALRDSLDTKLINKDIEVFSLEKGMGTKHIVESRNATTVLSHPRTKKYLDGFKEKISILVRNSSLKMENTCRENDWNLIANPTYFRKKMFEDKEKFRQALKQLDLPVPPGKITSVKKLHYGRLMSALGLPFVIQHPTRGGGKGTFFINNKTDFENALFKLLNVEDEDLKEKKQTERVIISKFIQGSSPSITGCVTKDGILSTNIQHQVLDMPELTNLERGSGRFCGHDWTSSNFPEKVQEQAYKIVEKVGLYLKENGYKGIFGLDFVMDKKTKKLFVTECNPRLLGSYPTLNMAQLLNNEIPILACHVLSFLNLDYQLDIENINRIMRQKKTGAQMIIHNLTESWARNYNELKAGVYKIENNKLDYLRPGYDLKHLKDKEEFILTDGLPFKKSHFSPNRRLCRILTLNNILSENHKELTPWAKQVAQTVYLGFQLKPVRFIRIKKIFFPNFLAKG